MSWNTGVRVAVVISLLIAGRTLWSAEPLVDAKLSVKDVPPIQMLVPGFSVYELPVDLPNINNVRYRADGKMYALCYNGDIWLLSDADDDGFEETATKFFDNKPKEGGVPPLRGPIGLAVIPFEHPVLSPDVKGPAPWKKGIAKRDDDDEVDAAVGEAENQKAPLTLALSPEDGGEGTKPENEKRIKPAGVIVASKGKVSAIIDYDGDGRADEEKIIATGWKEIPQNVDAVGVAIGFQGEIYFGLGTAAYNNAYLIDESGKAHYDIESERGTIQRILPDLSRRETVCTGVRFTIGLATNGVSVGGDDYESLFASDQEGATWLPNGNPFDELLYIEPGKHYGFPPQHPKHLPDVTDTPSLFDYGPQHQSTCGIALNSWRHFSWIGSDKKVFHDALFGPEEWDGDFFVTGQSRGKLYRTQVKWANSQYTARNHLIACLNMLTVDCCLSPKGDLIVACHSGGPDWGTGPTGKGKLFLIRYTDKKAPQPLSAWPAGPQEVRVAFDGALNPVHLKNLTAQTKITYGEFVAAGDRFETLRPGYAVVQMQQAAPRYDLPVHGVSVTSDRRTLVIATAPHRAAVTYAITLPGLGRVEGLGLKVDGQTKGQPNLKPSSDHQPSTINPQPLPQHPQIDLAYSLNGVLATWEPEDKTQRGWSGVLPHLDLNLCNEFSTGDANDDRFWECLKQKGTLTLETQLDLRNLLHPAVQPGSKLDHEWPSEEVFLLVEPADGSDQRVQMFVDGVLKGGDKVTVEKDDQGNNIASVERTPITLTPDKQPTAFIKIVVGTEDDIPIGSVTCFTDATEFGALPISRFFVPWADTKLTRADDSTMKRDIPELAGGSWGRGRRVFFSDEAGCAKCHVAHGSGGAMGPDLSNLIHRDYASVLRDVTLPSFAINPDFLASIVTLKDGRVLTGIVRSTNEVDGRGLRVDGQKSQTRNAVPQPSTLDPQPLVIGDKDGKLHVIARADIDEMKHSPLSIMPEGMPQKLGPERMRDLLTFLLTEPPHMPNDAKQPAPAPRTRAEVAKVIALVPSPPSSGERARVRGPNGEEASQPKEKEKPEQRTPHPNPLPSKARGEGTGRPLNILLVAGAKDHGPGEHDYPAWLRVWSELLRGADGVTVETAMEWPSPEQLAAADTIAFFQKGAWNAERAKAIDTHLAKGGGLVYIHWAIEGGAEAPAFAQRIGLASHAAKLKYRHGPLDLSFESLGLETGSDHPIGRNFDKVHFHDESYWLMQGDPSKIKLIATGIEEGEPRPLFWTLEPANSSSREKPSQAQPIVPREQAAHGGRVFVSILGHYSWTFDDPLFRILLLRGIAWSANEPVDRFNELATVGVKLAD